MKPPYLGKVSLWWCTHCNVPVLGKKCLRCGRETEKVSISPPGDVRPCFRADLELINRVTLREFGAELLDEKKVCVLNKASGLDRFDEVIQDGRVLGALYYDLSRSEFRFLPSLEGASRLLKGGKKIVEVKEEVLPFLERGSVVMPGIKRFSDDIERGDNVIVVSSQRVVGVGKAKLSSQEASRKDKGMFVKLRKFSRDFTPRVIDKSSDLNKTLEANLGYIERLEGEAVEFIKEMVEKHSLPVAVAFSGGKDSLATLLLVKKVVEPEIIFTDTGIEFPETYENVKKLGRVMVARAEDRFFRGLEIFGFPGRDHRWCCKVVKLGATARLLREKFPGGCLTFIGQRRYESELRARSPRVWRNPWLPSQLAASPIQNWRAIEVWLFLLKEKANINRLYTLGFERIGCWLCPGSDMAEVELMKEIHPELYKKLVTLLEREFSPEEIRLGMWRWRELPPGHRTLARDYAKRRKPASYKIKVESTEEGWRYKLPEPELWEIFKNYLNAIGRVTDMGEVVEVLNMRIDKSGVVLASERADEDIYALIEVLERAKFCLGCGVCLAQCNNMAIELRERAVIGEGCTHCQRCHIRCPVVRYRERELVFLEE